MVLLFLAAAVVAVMTTSSALAVSAQDNSLGKYPDQQDTGQGNDTSQPQNGPFGDNQSQGPPCGHQWCDWYQVCRWEYWGWDPNEGWTLLHTDGYCDTSS